MKKQTSAVLVTLLSIVGSAFGLGLGDIEVKSNLNEPLDAEIQLIQLQGLTAGEVLPTLAGNDDFRRAGVERSFFLSNIQFRVKESASGDVVVTLSTQQAIREPFLNFLVEINWPGGRLLKEYTILLDPPVFDTGLAVDALVVEPSSSAATTDLLTTTVISGTVSDQAPASASVSPRDDSLSEGEYRVKRNDTLWEIALQIPSGEGYSPQQIMLAIQDLNPKAFLKNNINRVKAGSVLTLPSSQQIAARTLNEAINEVQAQNNGAAPKLRAPVNNNTEVQLSASDNTASALPVGGEDKNPDGYLELTSDSELDTTTAAGDVTAEVDRLQNQLFVAEELNDQFELEKTELQSRVADLQEQIAIMERMLDIQNAGLAEVQQSLAQTEAAQAVVPDPVPTAVTDTSALTFDSILDKVKATISMAFAWVTTSATNMGIAAFAVVTLLVLPFLFRNKQDETDDTPRVVTDTAEDDDERHDFNADFDAGLLADDEDQFDVAAEDEPETLDAVVEAEMYMAYQKYDQAEEKLKEAYAEHPERTDIGVKLLEVYAEKDDTRAFAKLSDRLSLSSEQQHQVAQWRARMLVGAASQSEESSAEELDLNADEVPVLPASGEVQLNFDDLDNLDNLDNQPAQGESYNAIDYTVGDEAATADADDELIGSALDDYAVADTDEFANDLDFSLDLGDLDEDPLTRPSLDFSEETLDEALPVAELDLTVDDNVPVLDFSLEEDEDPATLIADTELELSDPLSADDDPFADLDDLDNDSALNSAIDDQILGELSVDEIELAVGRSASTSEPASSSEQADPFDIEAELDEDEFDFLSGSDEASTKLDLARAYIEMDDKDGARDILEEVAAEGNESQKAQAQALLGQL